MKSNQIVGKLGEEIACKFLISKGYKIIVRNYRTKYAELDIVAIKDDTVCIVEVKTRKDNNFIMAREAVDTRKRNKILAISKFLIDELELYNYNIRFDIIECYWSNREIIHIENAFEV